MEDSINKKFDPELNSIRGLTWLPWIGRDYLTGGVLLLGESHYCYENYTPKDIENYRQETREVIEEYATRGKNAGNQWKTYEPMEAVVNGIMDLSEGKIWSHVSYMNLIQKCMDNNNARPHWEDFLFGWKIVLQVINILRPAICVCFSTDKKNNRVNFNRLEEFKSMINFDYSIIPTEDTSQRISRCIVAKPAEITIDEYNCKIVFVQHASRIKGKNITEWNEIIKQNLN